MQLSTTAWAVLTATTAAFIMWGLLWLGTQLVPPIVDTCTHYPAKRTTVCYP